MSFYKCTIKDRNTYSEEERERNFFVNEKEKTFLEWVYNHKGFWEETVLCFEETKTYTREEENNEKHFVVFYNSMAINTLILNGYQITLFNELNRDNFIGIGVGIITFEDKKTINLA